ncbi:MAG: hypothetical protein JXR70_13755 [Spirochaetales bacterium]|nr:hypothetical protein [Spirochaetales bacterium]
MEPSVSKVGLYVTPASPSKVFYRKQSGKKRFDSQFLKKLAVITPIPNAFTTRIPFR